MQLGRFSRLRFAHLPTPLEPMETLTRLLGGPSLYVKRDDCTGLATGGNKTRKLEFLAAEALRQGADTLITQGAVQSNHARQTAAIAARLGLKCESLLENRTGSEDRDYCGAGYGVPTDAMLEAAQLTVRHEGILLDPVYTGKGMAGLIGLVRGGAFTRDQNVVFLHTGGSAGLFGYTGAFPAGDARERPEPGA